MASPINPSIGLPLLLDHLRMQKIPCQAREDVIRFQTILPPLSVSIYTQSSGFGGMTIALAIQAAFHSISFDRSCDEWFPFSVMGHFLKPISTSSPVLIDVECVRSTEKFQTRIIRIRNSTSENILSFIATIDFSRRSDHVIHPIAGKALQSSELHPKTFETLNRGPDAFEDWKEVAETREERQSETSIKDAVKNYKAIYDQRAKLIQMRIEPKGLLSESLSAMAPVAKSKEQFVNFESFLHPSDMLEHVWKRPSSSLLQHIDHHHSDPDILSSSPASITFAQIAFNLDPRVIGSMCVINQIPFGKGQNSVSLDFSIRFHAEDIEIDHWHLYETQIKDQGHGKFFGETRCYNQSGRKIASASQQAALRFNPKYLEDLEGRRKEKSHSRL